MFLLEVPRDVLVDRLSGRRICRNCGAVYHVRNIPPKVEGVCDACGGALVHRADDNEETITQRLKVYEAQTSPLVAFYEDRSKLRVVPAEGEIDAVYERLLSALGESLPAG